MALDDRAFALLEALPSFPFNRLVRQDRGDLLAARRAFFQNGTLPTFTYSLANRFDASAYAQALNNARRKLETLKLDASIHKMYRDKFTELETRNAMVVAIQKCDDRASAKHARMLFGTSHSTAATYQEEFNEHLARASKLHEHRRRISAELFASMVKEVLAQYGLDNWQVTPANRATLKIAHGKAGSRPVIRVPQKLNISKNRAIRLLTHEIEVHALRTANGFASPLKILGRGLANYIETEEGLAMYFQEQAAPHVSRPGFWNAWTVALMEEYGFSMACRTIQGAKEKLLRARGVDQAQLRSQRFAWRLCVRATRGLTNPGAPGLAYPKDRIYRDGFNRVHYFLAEHPQDLQLLFLGNVGLDDLPVLKKFSASHVWTPDLMSRKVVQNILRQKKLATS